MLTNILMQGKKSSLRFVTGFQMKRFIRLYISIPIKNLRLEKMCPWKDDYLTEKLNNVSPVVVVIRR